MKAQPALKKNTTDYQAEIATIHRDISELQGSLAANRIDSERATKFVYRLYHRASLTGNPAELVNVEHAIDTAIQRLGAAEDLYLLKANLHFKLHRLAETKLTLNAIPRLGASFEGRALLADIAFQEGKYELAQNRYRELADEHPAWDNLARLAYLRNKMGDFEEAEKLYIEAEDELTAKEMRSYAWLELQRGVLHLTRGNYERARIHYERAGRAYSGYWLVDEHMAELLAAEEKFDEASELYENLAARAPKPELQQALAELYALMGKNEEAQPWAERALAAYLKSAERGEVHYYHHLADFYAHVREDGARAATWARKDIELRENYSTQAALAWALYLNGEVAEALETIRRALSSGVKEAEMYLQAAAIHRAAARAEEGDGYLRTAAEINPHFRNFHVHR
ncbi:MAG: tetratricopeptide repeat protein [Bryobacteraceae bacterium]